MLGEETTPDPDADGRTTVLEVFGMKLQVKNRRLAEVLTMDAAEALGLERRPGQKPGAEHAERIEPEVISEAVPDVLLSMGGAREEEESRLRAETRTRLDELGAEFGFDVQPGSRWVSRDGLVIHTRVVSRALTPAAATDMVSKLAQSVVSGPPGRESVLLVAAESVPAGPLLAAVTTLGTHSSFRVAHLDDLERLRELCARIADPTSAVEAVLLPRSAVDVSAVLALNHRT